MRHISRKLRARAAAMAAAFTCIATLGGCATQGAPFPEYRSVTIAVSGGPGIEWAGDYEIPGSQVSVGGRDGMLRTFGWMGLLGYGISSAIDRVRNASDLGPAEGVLGARFDDILARELRDRSHDERVPIRVRARNDPALSMILQPGARFLHGGAPEAELALYVEAQFGEPTKVGFSKRKTYLYLPAEKRPFLAEGGWAENDGAAFRAVAQRAFARLAEAFAADVRGALGSAPGASAATIRWRRTSAGEDSSGTVLREHADYFVALPVVGPARGTGVVLVERGLVLP